ncbi:MAG: ABC transporter permease [Acidimicrobiia bacterium]
MSTSTPTDTATDAPSDDRPTGRQPADPPRLGGGWRIVAHKEFVDHVRSVRFLVLIVLIALAGLAAVNSAAGPIRDAAEAASETPSIFLYLFTLSPDRVPAFHEFVAILGPLLGIGFGFDAISGERSQHTLPRLVSQPIHRDEIVNGKFVAGLSAIGLALAAVMAIVGGYGALQFGVGPTWSDLARVVAFYVVTLAYVALWLALAILLSVFTRRAATAALTTIAIWLVFTLFGGLIAGVIADAIRPIDAESTAEQVLDNARLELDVRRISPDQLYRDATGVLLNPSQRSTGIVVTDQTGALPSELPLGESLLLAWWQLLALIGAGIAMFATAYVGFLRQEVRA